MPSLRQLFLLAVFFAAATVAHAATSDCTLAHTPREHAVCDNPKLSALDSRLTLAYAHLRSQLSSAASNAVQSDQRDWLHWLDAVCPVHGHGERANLTGCLTSEYTRRIAALTPGPTLPNGHLVYPRTRYVITLPAKNTPAMPPEVQNPGYGVGTFQWPQIDTPNPREAAWNHAVYLQVLALSSDPTHHPTSLEAAVNPFGTSDIAASIHSVNNRFVSTGFTVFTNGYGAAHPLTARTTFNWWLTRNRQLLASDIFLDTTSWQTSLIAPIIARLASNPDLKPYLWKDDELRKGITSSLTDPTSWTLSPSGLTLRFSQYAVAPYVAGMPTATLSWQELTPYLNPEFHPADLPPPDKKD